MIRIVFLFFLFFIRLPSVFAQHDLPLKVKREDSTSSEPVKYRRASLFGIQPQRFLQTVRDAKKYNFNSLEVQLEQGTLVPLAEFAEKNNEWGLIKTAHEADLSVYLWVHEFEDLPEEWHKADKSKLYDAENDKGNAFIRTDNEALWEWLENKYETMVQMVPEADGFTLTLTESQYWATGDEDVTYKTVKTIYDVLKKHNKKLVYRTFSYTPRQMELLSQVAQKLPTDIVLEAKEVPQDWHFYLPYGPDIGRFPQHEQIIEIDIAGEYWGRSHLLNLFPAYLVERLSYTINEQSAQGVVVRLDRFKEEARNTFNDINLYAAAAIMNNPSVTADEIWHQWATDKFGAHASSVAINVLKPSWEAAKQTIYTKGYIISDRMPAPSLVKGFVDRPFHPHYWDSTYNKTWELIKYPTESFIQETVKEKERSLKAIKSSIDLLQQNKKLFADSLYQELAFQLQRSKVSLELYSLISEAMLRYKLYTQTDDLPLKALQKNRLSKIVDESDPVLAELKEEFLVNGTKKTLKFYLTDIPEDIFQELQSNL